MVGFEAEVAKIIDSIASARVGVHLLSVCNYFVKKITSLLTHGNIMSIWKENWIEELDLSGAHTLEEVTIGNSSKDSILILITSLPSASSFENGSEPELE